jgi:MoxR-like ATPase
MTTLATDVVEPSSVEETEQALAAAGYLPDGGLSAAVFLSLKMRRPLLLEGEAGVGKTELAKTLAKITGSELIRLQCYEGIDAGQALYDWDYSRQLLATHLHSDSGQTELADLYQEDFLLERPVLKAIRAQGRAVLLIDELDRADDEFEAFLLEALSDVTVTVPELGPVHAAVPPLVVITSNRTRELHDALKRRCLYHWIAFPDDEREAAIVRARVPEASPELAASVARLVSKVRSLDVMRLPGPAEAIDWARALALVGADAITPDAALMTAGLVIKNEDDLRILREHLHEICDDESAKEAAPQCS